MDGINGGGRDGENESSLDRVSITALLGRMRGLDCNLLAISSVKLERDVNKSSRARELPKSSVFQLLSNSSKDISGDGEFVSTSKLLLRGPKSISLCCKGGV